MISSLTQCNSYIIIYQFQLSNFENGEIFTIPSLAQCNSYIIIYQFQLSKLKKGINKLSNCNNDHIHTVAYVITTFAENSQK